MIKEGVRYCNCCGESEFTVKFYKHKKGRGGFLAICAGCTQKKWRESPAVASGGYKEYVKRYYEARRDKLIAYNRDYMYSLPDGWYDKKYQEQGGKCACCLEHHDKLCVDHCHKTNLVRGLLCSRCNHALGHLRDNPETAARMVGYLKADYWLNPVVNPKRAGALRGKDK
jgi:hypothetical protein